MDSEIESKILGIISEIADEPVEGEITRDSDLLVSGCLDSFGFVQLLMELEQTFDLLISEDDQLDPRLRSVSGLVSFVQQK